MAALISVFSTEDFSSQHTGPIFIGLLHWLLPHASENALELIHHLIRKGAHLFEYGVLGILLLRAIRGSGRGWKLRWAILALAIAAGYSGVDEFHQSFVPGRNSSVWDSLLDTCGAATGELAFWAALKLRRESHSDTEAQQEV
jgi:VanZ family protein